MARLTLSHAAPVPAAATTAPRPSPGPRYHAEFVDLKNFKIQHELLRTSPSSSCFATTSCHRAHCRRLVIAVSDLAPDDPRRNRRPARSRIVPRVATLSQITDLLKKTEQSQRVLDEQRGLTSTSSPATKTRRKHLD